jgi:hypothetical protein
VVKAMKAVFPPELPVLAVGSITPEKIRPYWQAGVRGFGLGGSLYRPGDGPAEWGLAWRPSATPSLWHGRRRSREIYAPAAFRSIAGSLFSM